MIEGSVDPLSIQFPDSLDGIFELLASDKSGGDSVERLESREEFLEAFAFRQVKKKRFCQRLTPRSR
jgi:hypothetical protein